TDQHADAVLGERLLELRNLLGEDGRLWEKDRVDLPSCSEAASSKHPNSPWSTHDSGTNSKKPNRSVSMFARRLVGTGRKSSARTGTGHGSRSSLCRRRAEGTDLLLRQRTSTESYESAR